MREFFGTDTIRGRFRLLSAGVGILLIFSGTIGWWTTSRLAAQVRVTLLGVREEVALSSQFSTAIAQEIQAASHYLDLRDSTSARNFKKFSAQAHDAHRQLARRTGQTAEEASLIAGIDQRLSLAETYFAGAHRLVDIDQLDAARAENDRTVPILQETLSNVERLNELTSEKLKVVSAELESETRREATLIVALMIGAIIIALLMSRLLASSITDPLSAVLAHARRLSQGDFGARTDMQGLPGEFRVLAMALNQAADSLGKLSAAESALRQSEKLAAVGQLVSGVAHQLNNPLAGILLTVEETLDEPRTAEDRQAMLAVRELAMRARGIVRDLLAFVHDRHAAREPVLLTELMRKTMTTVGDRLERLGVSLETSLPSDLPPLLVDRVGVERVLTHVILNGAEAAGQGGTVRVSARSRAEMCDIIVEDTGKGVPLHVLPRMFEPFFTTKPIGEGTGLGLSVALGVAEQHGGTMRVENRDAVEGGGARVIITLPLAWLADGKPAGQSTLAAYR